MAVRIIKREKYLARIRPFIDSELVKILTGIRRSGKSVLLSLIREELLNKGVPRDNIVFFNFESQENMAFAYAEGLHDKIRAIAEKCDGRIYLFFDEIQIVDNWEVAINSIRATFDCDIFITGSNSKLLSSELSTHLAGRCVQFVVYPFGFEEFIESYRANIGDATREDMFRQFLLVGGMPYVFGQGLDPDSVRQYLSDTYKIVQVDDIARRYSIRNIDLLERVANYVTVNTGTAFSANNIVKFLKNQRRPTTSDTVLNYLRYFCDAFIFYKVPQGDVIGKEIFASNEKYYIADHGIREAVFGGNMRQINLILENIVFIEALRRGFKVYVGKVRDKEIDFVCFKQNKKIYIQVTYLLASEETLKREFGVYADVKDNFPKYVVSMDTLDFSENGIMHRNIIDFLLQDEW